MMAALSTGKNSIFGPAALCTGLAGGLERERPAMTLPTSRGADRSTPETEVRMAPEADNPHGGTAQRFIDPLVSQARLINEAAHIERRLAIRRALRPERSNAAKRGWEARRDR